MGRERCLEGLEILHPLERKVMWLDVCLVEHQDEGESGLVEDGTGVEHVGHEGGGGGGARSVDDVGDDGGEGGGDGVGDDGA